MEHRRGLKKRHTCGEKKQPAIIKDKRAGPLSFFRDHAVELSAVLCVMYLAPNSGDPICLSENR